MRTDEHEMKIMFFSHSKVDYMYILLVVEKLANTIV